MDYLSYIFPTATPDDLEMINEALTNNGIHDNKLRTAYFWTQVLFETADFRKLVENLNYTTPARIVAVWPSRFNLTGKDGKLNANEFTRNPQKLANHVYSNRLGNSNPQSNDGWNYRGRGAMHLTGKSNYRQASMDIYGDDRLVRNPDSVASNLVIAIDTAVWFWVKHRLNELADEREFTKITKIINGSTTTVPQRKAKLEQIRKIIT